MAKKKPTKSKTDEPIAETKTQRKRAKREQQRKEYSKNVEKAQFHREIYVLLGTALIILIFIVAPQFLS